MAKPAPEYELVLMLDPETPDEQREKIAADARQRITSGGELKHDTAWGMRKLAYEIRQRTEADYRFFRFENGGNLLDDLNHNLKIADGVLRFRIFKVDPRSPVIVPPPPTPLSSGRPERGDRREGGRRGEEVERPAAPAAPAEAPAAAAPAEEAPAPAAAAPAEEAPAPAEEAPAPAGEAPAPAEEAPAPAETAEPAAPEGDAPEAAE
jgi:small subunit ribosomal protein S6